MKLKHFFFLPVVFIVFFSSCISTKRLIYFQDLDSKADTLFPAKPSEYRLQVNDMIQVEIRSDDPSFSAVKPFNLVESGEFRSISVQGGDIYYMFGYSVNDSGYIDLPVLGPLKVKGLTLEEVKFQVMEKLPDYLKNPNVIVRYGGLKYSVLGEVARPGKYIALQNQITVFEALAQAGDLNAVAKRDKVVLVRQYPDGSRIHHLNLLDDQILRSPYYFLQHNDLIYIEPLKVRTFGTGVTAFQTFTSTLSALSSTLLIINLIR